MKSLLIPLLLVGFNGFSPADDASKPDAKTQPGHSMHGEAFNEGPRQAAVLMGGTGDVHFPVTTKVPEAQQFVDQGIGQLHGFWYFEAERSFRQAAALDPDCALAYWGMAQANTNNPKRAAEFIRQAVKRRDQAGRREQLWIDSLAAYYADEKKDEKERRTALVRALEDLTYEFPDDLEAKAFLVLQIWDNSNHGLPLQSRRMLDALCKEVLEKSPMHPGIHHYRIHVWNKQNGDKRALDAAAHCGQSAPAIAHMWHMSGHTFSNLKRYPDAAWQQEASARVDHASMIATRIMPDQIHNFAHNNDWLVKNFGYIGRVHDGIDLAKNMVELPRVSASIAKSYALGRERLVEMLLKFELWDDLLALEGTIYLEANDNPVAEVGRLRALGVAAFAKGDRGRGDAKVSLVEAALKKAREERIAAADAAETKAKNDKKSEEDIARAMADALRKFNTRIDITTGALADLRMSRALLDGRFEAAKTEIARTRDLGADRQARIWLQLGDKVKAESLARDAISKDDQQVQPVANLAWVLWQIGKKDEAKKTFEKLRAISSGADLDLPVFARLEPIVRELGLAADWRMALPVRNDVGERPSLETLGPFRWHPSLAPDWNLSDSEGRAHGLSDFKGRPVLVVFYLGSGCTGCMEQLNIFAPLAKEFDAAGISLVAVSTDAVPGLHETFAKAADKVGFPFPIVADPELVAFKAYRAFDDFEKIPLHGTFLIDGEGLVRWQDLGFQPFREAKWLLGESKRLLSIPASRNLPALSTATAGR
jgi:peroxiredoxin/tetratricopeptide (TPR) repeat protein